MFAKHQLLAGAAIAACAVSPVAQLSVTLGASKDNTMFQDGNNLSNGAGTRMFCGNTAFGSPRRALIAFDIATAIPPCSTILAAELRLTMAITISARRNVTMHRVLADWGERGSFATGGFGGQGTGGRASLGDLTWTNRFFPKRFWTNPGGDFVPKASAITMVGTTGTYPFGSTPDMVSDVQDWLDNPQTNFGWMLRTLEVGNTTARGFHTREAAAAVRPFLQIRYLPPPSATVTAVGAGCAGSGVTPLIAGANGLPTIGNANFALTLSGGPAPLSLEVYILTLGLLPAPFPFGAPGCAVLVDPATFLIALPAFGGSSPLPIPNNPVFKGLNLQAQGYVDDIATGALVLSNALTLQIGS